jgi:hypothetical protein
MKQETNAKIIQQEMELLKADIIAVYNASGKKVSGEFEKGLELSYGPDSAKLTGYVYLAGRKAGKQPPIQAIENWLIAKGIKPIEDNMKISTLAFLIARKIAKEGTKKENHLAIYDQVITPQRIQEIFEKINQINVIAFTNEITILIQKLVENK